MDNQNRSDLDNRLYEMLSEFNQGRPRFRSADSDYEIVSSLLQQYTSTMRDYNTNMRQIIRIISTHQSSRRPANPFQYYYNYTNWIPSEPRPQQQNRILSREEIARETMTYGFTEEMIIYDNQTGEPTNVCPISLEAFQVGDVVCEIRGCRHKFKRPSLITWLRRNTKCPVCRFDLAREETPVVDASGQEQPPPVLDPSGQEQDSSNENPGQNLQSTITQLLQGFLNGQHSNLDISGNRLLYEFEIPMNSLFQMPPEEQEVD
jgi:hypothetical protein